MSDSPYHLFEAYGVEMEYMLVDRHTLTVQPIVDRLIYEIAGAYLSEIENGAIAWSNELVSHVIELKTNGPSPTLHDLAAKFQQNVVQINGMLEKYNVCLLPTGAHPLMDPLKETKLWPHQYNKIYALYHHIFDCRGHGWSNLQSTHLNLPFADDAEFGRLHAAIRLLLPIIPALSASTPILDGQVTGWHDTRLEMYRHNQAMIPSIAGQIIPEAVFTHSDYDQQIFQPITHDMQPYDTEHILEYQFLNSRGAIARFDRNTIEIRTIDIQECPAADIAILTAIVAVLKLLVQEKWQSFEAQCQWPADELAAIFLSVIRQAEDTPITHLRYLQLFGQSVAMTAGELWWSLLESIGSTLPEPCSSHVRFILTQGTLASRILRALNKDGTNNISTVYHQLVTCLQKGQLFSA